MRRVAGILLACLLAATSGCSWPWSGGGDGHGGGSGGRRPGPDDPAFVTRGRYQVGVRTLDVNARKVELFYPAARGSTDGLPKVVYDVRTGMSEALARSIPPALIIPDEVDAYRDVPVSHRGRFPVVLFSHGKGGWRTVNAHLLSDIASWGFVVASTDHMERNLEAVVTKGGAHDQADFGAPFQEATLERVLQEGRSGGVLAGAVDDSRIAAVGHSAGGGAAMALSLVDDRIDVVVSWAASGPVDLGDTPLMIIAAEGDPITSNMKNELTRNHSPTRVVELANSGHAVFTDVCPGVTGPDGLLGRFEATYHITLPEDSIRLIKDGCEPGDTPVTDAWPTILHFTVAELRDTMHIGRPGVGLGEGVVPKLPAEVTYDISRL